ncbi:hypothetical protein ACE0DR_03615 [Azotobacter sp. CWF10]
MAKLGSFCCRYRVLWLSPAHQESLPSIFNDGAAVVLSAALENSVSAQAHGGFEFLAFLFELRHGFSSWLGR